MSDWFQVLFEKTVLPGGFTSILINILLRIPGYIKKVKKVWILLYAMI